MILEGKYGVVFGVANDRSIAWGVARTLAREGMKLVLVYQGEKLKSRVAALAKELGDESAIIPCDLTKDEELNHVYEHVKSKWGVLDTIIHSVAFAPADDLRNPLYETSRAGYLLTQDISSYSLIALARTFLPLMTRGGSITAMTYLGSIRAVENYNVMGPAKAALEANIRYLANELGSKGIRVNGISAGPIRTLASAGVRGFLSILKKIETEAPLKRNVSLDEVGGVAAFLSSDLSSALTGAILPVDCGYSIVG